MSYQTLLQPFPLHDLTLPNRVVMAPMTRSRAGSRLAVHMRKSYVIASSPIPGWHGTIGHKMALRNHGSNRRLVALLNACVFARMTRQPVEEVWQRGTNPLSSVQWHPTLRAQYGGVLERSSARPHRLRLPAARAHTVPPPTIAATGWMAATLFPGSHNATLAAARLMRSATY